MTALARAIACAAMVVVLSACAQDNQNTAGADSGGVIDWLFGSGKTPDQPAGFATAHFLMYLAGAAAVVVGGFICFKGKVDAGLPILLTGLLLGIYAWAASSYGHLIALVAATMVVAALVCAAVYVGWLLWDRRGLSCTLKEVTKQTNGSVDTAALTKAAAKRYEQVKRQVGAHA